MSAELSGKQDWVKEERGTIAPSIHSFLSCFTFPQPAYFS
jgi:hypothetical protein